MRKQTQQLSLRLFLRCQSCFNIVLVKFQRRSQFTFLKPSTHHRYREGQWLFQTVCRRCQQDIVPASRFAGELDEHFIPVNQIALELSGNYVLIALHNDLAKFFLSISSPDYLTTESPFPGRPFLPRVDGVIGPDQRHLCE